MTGDAERNGLTRRDALRYGGTALGGSLLAGCAGTGGPSSTDGNGSATEGGTEGPSGNGTATGTPEGGSYSVSMAPAGEVTLDAVPENVLVYSLLYADMAVAYGHGDAVNSLGFDAAAGGDTLSAYYDRLDGVSFDGSDLPQLNTGSGGITVDKELLYELDSDLHLADPCLFRSFDGWEAADVEEVRSSVAPWFGNVFSRAHGQPPEGCRDGYQYYTLWEIAERVAAVFRERARFAELAAVHEDLLGTVRADLPPEGERPTVGSVIFVDGTFYPSRSDTPGFGNAHVRPLGAPDAFAGEGAPDGATYDYEAMLAADPDVILHQFGIASYYDVDEIRETLADHPVAGDLTAVREGRFYPSANPVQGPVMNLFQLEMTAKQLYPERFGEWPAYDGGAYPEIPEGERLFDRGRVASILASEGGR